MIRVLSVLSLLLLAGTLRAQPVNIRVTNDFEKDAEEVSIAVSQENANHIAIGANLKYLFTSTDRGETWVHQQMSSAFGFWGDPALAFEGDRLYYAHLAGNLFGDSATWLNGMIIQQSTDMGQTWITDDALSRGMPKQQDKPTITEAGYRKSIIAAQRMLMSWTQFDHYASHAPMDSSRILLAQAKSGVWDEPVRVDDTAGTCLDDDNTAEGAVVAGGGHGEIYCVWALNNKIYFDRSLTGQLQFGKDQVLAEQPGGWDVQIPGFYRANAFPTIACDTSIDRIYVVWSVQQPFETNIFLRFSDDSGSTWSDIKQINTSDVRTHHFYPCLALDRTTGHLAVLYYAFDDETATDVDVYLARSHDHGTTWTNERISAKAFHPNDHVFFGDYIQVAADHGMIYPAWMRLDSLALSVWTAVIPDSDVAAVMPPVNHAESLQIVHAMSGANSIEFTLSEDATVTLTMSDALGRDVRTELRGNYSAGSYRITPSPTGITGVHFVRMSVSRAGEEHIYFGKYIE